MGSTPLLVMDINNGSDNYDNDNTSLNKNEANYKKVVTTVPNTLHLKTFPDEGDLLVAFRNVLDLTGIHAGDGVQRTAEKTLFLLWPQVP